MPNGLKLMLLGILAYFVGFFAILYFYTPATLLAILMGTGGIATGVGFAHTFSARSERDG